jgi:hypothetical protein
MQIGWGQYLLDRALETYDAEPLICGGQAPVGYAFQPATPWVDIITQGLRNGDLTLDGNIKYQLERSLVMAT